MLERFFHYLNSFIENLFSLRNMQSVGVTWTTSIWSLTVPMAMETGMVVEMAFNTTKSSQFLGHQNVTVLAGKRVKT
jgi:hypothetical protein